MTEESFAEQIVSWLNDHVVKGGGDVASRLVVFLAALERLYDTPELKESVHLTPNKQQLKKHDAYCKAALARFGVSTPVKAFGRRASNLSAWLEPLFDLLRSFQFDNLEVEPRAELLRAVEEVAADRLRILVEAKPLLARYHIGTPIAILEDLLDQAQAKKRAKDVAEYLVGAKLQLRLGAGVVSPKNVNTPSGSQLADFRVGTTALEVTVNAVDDRHLKQIQGILRDTSLDVWLLVRRRDRQSWQKKIEEAFPDNVQSIAVFDLESFLGQNTSEIGGFDRHKVREVLSELFDVYHNTWLPAEGTKGILISTLEPDTKPTSQLDQDESADV